MQRMVQWFGDGGEGDALGWEGVKAVNSIDIYQWMWSITGRNLC